MPREELRCFEALLRNAPQHDELHSPGHETRSIGSRYSDQPVVQTGQSRLHNFKDKDMRAPLGRLNRMVETRIFPSRTVACLAGSPSRSSRGSARLRPMGFDAAAFAALQRRLVEPIGIEPTTSSLQSS